MPTWESDQLHCEETPFGTALVLTTSQGRVVLDGDDAGELIEALLDWMGSEEVRLHVNRWCRAMDIPTWEDRDAE